MTPEERAKFDKAYQELRDQFLAGKIDNYTYKQRKLALNKLNIGAVEQAKQIQLEDLPVGNIVPAYKPNANVDKSVGDAYEATIDWYQDNQGLSYEEAAEKSRQDVLAKLKPATPQFRSDPPVFRSDIVRTDQGLMLRDPVTQEIREMTAVEKITQPFLRQQVASLEDYNRTLAQQEMMKEERAKERAAARQKFVEQARLNRQLIDQGLVNPDITLTEFEQEQLQDLVKSGEEAFGGLVGPDNTTNMFGYDSSVPALTEDEIKEWLAKQRGKDRIKEKLIGKVEGAERVMVSPDYQAGVVYEPTLSAGIRSLNLIGGGAAAVILTPAYEANLIPGLKETETFQLAKSGEILDQFALNMVNATDVMDYYKNNELIVAELEAAVPGYGQSIATGMGFFASAMNPYAGPGLILKGISKPIVGYAKTMAAKNVVDNMLRTAAVKNADGGVLTAKEIIDQELNPTLSYWLSNVERNDLNDLASERVAEHLSAATTIRAGLDANGSISAKELGDIAATPTGVAIVNNAVKKDMEPFYAKVKQYRQRDAPIAEDFEMFKNDLPSWYGSADGPVLTRQNSGDYVSSLLQPYKEAAKTNRAVARIYNESQAALRMSREALELTGEAKRINTDSLTTEFQNEVIRSRLAKEISEGNVSLDELAKVIKSARNEDGVLTSEAIGKLGLKYDTTTASLSDMFVGLRNTLKTPLRERLLNFLPTNLKVVASDTVIDVSKDQTKKFLKNKNFKAHLNNLKNKQKSIDFKDDSYIITNNKVKNEIVKDVIDYYGADRIRQSEGLRSLLNNLLDNKIE